MVEMETCACILCKEGANLFDHSPNQPKMLARCNPGVAIKCEGGCPISEAWKAAGNGRKGRVACNYRDCGPIGCRVNLEDVGGRLGGLWEGWERMVVFKECVIICIPG